MRGHNASVVTAENDLWIPVIPLDFMEGHARPS